VSETDLENAPGSFESCGVLALRVGFERSFQALIPVVRLPGRGGIIFGNQAVLGLSSTSAVCEQSLPHRAVSI